MAGSHQSLTSKKAPTHPNTPARLSIACRNQFGEQESHRPVELCACVHVTAQLISRAQIVACCAGRLEEECPFHQGIKFSSWRCQSTLERQRGVSSVYISFESTPRKRPSRTPQSLHHGEGLRLLLHLLLQRAAGATKDLVRGPTFRPLEFRKEVKTPTLRRPERWTASAVSRGYYLASYEEYNCV